MLQNVLYNKASSLCALFELIIFISLSETITNCSHRQVEPIFHYNIATFVSFYVHMKRRGAP